LSSLRSINWEQTAADFPNRQRISTVTNVSESPGDLVSHLFLPDCPAFPTEMLNEHELYERIISCVNVHPSELSNSMNKIEENVISSLSPYVLSMRTCAGDDDIFSLLN
jgi:hypothetical protein